MYPNIPGLSINAAQHVHHPQRLRKANSASFRLHPYLWLRLYPDLNLSRCAGKNTNLRRSRKVAVRQCHVAD